MTIKVLDSGFASTIQDLGRPGYYHLGIPIGGAMDRYSMRIGNMLVGNDESAAVVETVFTGPVLEFRQNSVVAVTGGELPPKLDGRVMPTWTSFEVREGQILSFDYLKHGARSYIAIHGGFSTPVSLGSRSTYAIGALGGIDGRGLKEGDVLPIGSGAKPAKVGKTISVSMQRIPKTPVELRVLPGLYLHRITKDSAEEFFSGPWRVAPEADRMGYRFQGGNSLSFIDRKPPFGAGSDPSNITDACYPYGSIQVPGGTEPIVLHRDAVSGGGYFMLGTVISADMDLIGQLQPHAETNFVKIDMEGALFARKSRSRMLDMVREYLN